MRSVRQREDDLRGAKTFFEPVKVVMVASTGGLPYPRRAHHEKVRRVRAAGHSGGRARLLVHPASLAMPRPPRFFRG